MFLFLNYVNVLLKIKITVVTKQYSIYKLKLFYIQLLIAWTCNGDRYKIKCPKGILKRFGDVLQFHNFEGRVSVHIMVFCRWLM